MFNRRWMMIFSFLHTHTHSLFVYVVLMLYYQTGVYLPELFCFYANSRWCSDSSVTSCQNTPCEQQSAEDWVCSLSQICDGLSHTPCSHYRHVSPLYPSLTPEAEMPLSVSESDTIWLQLHKLWALLTSDHTHSHRHTQTLFTLCELYSNYPQCFT